MNASLKLAASGLALALASSAAPAQSVISRSITAEPVETTVTQTPAGTIVTRRPLGEQPAALVAPEVTPPVFAQPTVPAATFVDTAPETVDVFTTRQVVRRAEAARETRPMVTRQVAAPRHPAVKRTHAQRASTTVRQRPAVQRTTRAVRDPRRVETRQVALTGPAPRIVLNPRERQIIYRTVVEREVIPSRQVIVAPSVVPAPAYVAPFASAPVHVAPRGAPPVVAADEIVVTDPITVGTVLPENVPLYAMPQNVALTVPATQRYSYAWLGGRAYLVDPASGVVVADLSE
jgi:uncharacterized protein DUF1236